MAIDPSIFKSYDIRAIYPTELDEEGVEIVAQSIYKVISQKSGKDKLRFVLSRDMRLSSPSLFAHAKKALVGIGAEVYDMGLASTPTFYFAVFSKGFDAGFQISASHNTKEWNGLKIVMNSPQGLVKIGKNTGMEDVKKLSLETNKAKENGGGSVVELPNVVSEEVEYALKITDNPKIKEFKIVADAASSMGAIYINELMKKIPGKIIRMNFELDGTFPAHQADPLNFDTLVGLQKKVREEKADIGFAPDGDGDRFFFLDENGEVVPPTIITSLVAREILKKNKDQKILFDIRYIFTPTKIVDELGGKWEITKVGHASITEKMHETGAIFAGESSSHFFFKETGNGEAPIPVILMVLNVMTRENKKMSEIVEELRRSYESGEVNYKVNNALEILESLKQKYSDGELSEYDGVAITYPSWRFNARTSNTEPLLRLNVEGYNKQDVEEKFSEIKSLIESMAKHD